MRAGARLKRSMRAYARILRFCATLPAHAGGENETFLHLWGSSAHFIARESAPSIVEPVA